MATQESWDMVGAAMEREGADEKAATEELKHLELPRDRFEKTAQQNYAIHPWFDCDRIANPVRATNF